MRLADRCWRPVQAWHRHFAWRPASTEGLLVAFHAGLAREHGVGEGGWRRAASRNAAAMGFHNRLSHNFRRFQFG